MWMDWKKPGYLVRLLFENRINDGIMKANAIKGDSNDTIIHPNETGHH